MFFPRPICRKDHWKYFSDDLVDIVWSPNFQYFGGVLTPKQSTPVLSKLKVIPHFFPYSWREFNAMRTWLSEVSGTATSSMKMRHVSITPRIPADWTWLRSLSGRSAVNRQKRFPLLGEPWATPRRHSISSDVCVPLETYECSFLYRARMTRTLKSGNFFSILYHSASLHIWS